VPTTFVQQAVAARMRIPVVRVPLCVRLGDFPRNGRQIFHLPSNRPVILCMFDTGSHVDRKNPSAAIEAVDRACAAGHDPLLLIKAARTELHHGLADRLRREVRHVECRILEGWLDRPQTLSLIDACDMVVSLHRSEGFGLILAEAMAMGKAVVATGYSGNMDFMSPMNSFPVHYTLTSLQKAVGPYPAGACWAEPDVEHAAHLIGEVLDHPEQARQVGSRAAADIARSYSVDAVAEVIRKRLASLGFRFPAQASGTARHRPANRPDRVLDSEPGLARKVA
jgi:glycosyltransferase involved in cell wall biosynthesis